MFYPLCDRVVDPTQPVEVYRNLHNGKLSVRQNNLVVGHCDSITLDLATFKVSKAGQERVRRERKKYVHATVRGMLVDFETRRKTSKQVAYNPYKHDEFVFVTTQTKASVGHNELITIDATKGMWISSKPNKGAM